LLSLAQDLSPHGEPKQLTHENAQISGPVWTRDGREIIFVTGVGIQSPSLHRIAITGGTAEQLAIAGEGVAPAISTNGNRLAYARPLFDSNIWRLQLPAAEAGKPRSAPFISSSHQEENAQYSPDGKRIAFESDRSGSPEIWVSDDQGSHAVQVTSLGKGESGSPRWSPDGRHIAFDWNVAGHWDIYTVNASGGSPRRMTSDPPGSAIPSYSRDGRWLYFASGRTGRDEIWKMPVEGGGAIQITRNGGLVALESIDGKWLYYLRSEDSPSLWKRPTSGGGETQLALSVQARAFAVTNVGIYYIAPAKHGALGSIDFINFKTNAPKTLVPLMRTPYLGLTVSPDGRSLLYSQFDQAGADLMLIENFR
jgi:Tol biopolymer transport system component